MKQIVLFIAALIMSLLYGTASAQEGRRVILVESFGWNCAPCNAWLTSEQAFLSSMTPDTVVSILYWPFWENAEAQERAAYYGVNQGPLCQFDGTIRYVGLNNLTAQFETTVRSEVLVGSDYLIQLHAYATHGDDSVFFRGMVRSLSSAETDTLRLFVTLIYDSIGTSPILHYLFKDTWPDPVQGLNIVLGTNDSVQVEGALLKYAEDHINDLRIVSFVQSGASPEVQQAAMFQVVDSSASWCLISYPNGGENIRVFTEDTIRWSASNEVASVSIEINRNYPIGMWETIAVNAENDSEYAWTVTDPLSSNCRMRISLAGDTVTDLSDASFSITSSAGYLALVSGSMPEQPRTELAGFLTECGTAQSETLFVKNFGSENIVVFAPALVSGAQFNVSHDCPPFFALSPGQMSTCSITLTYDPQAEGSHRDTLRMQTDAVNAIGGYVRIPLAGSQTRTPASPQVVITTQGQDARLSWAPVTLSGGDCPIAVTEYMVFYSEVSDGPFWYHGYTTDTTYVHGRVIAHANGMFYHVVASTAPISLLLDLPPSGQNPPISEEQVLQMLRERRVAYEHVAD